MTVFKAGLMPCPSCGPREGALQGASHGPRRGQLCSSLVLTFPHETDGRFNEVDARRIVAAWNYTRDIPLETLETHSETAERQRKGDTDDAAVD